jgi:hypothetical protein
VHISIALVAGGHEPPADPGIGVREPRRPRPNGGTGTVLLEPLL